MHNIMSRIMFHSAQYVCVSVENEIEELINRWFCD